MYYILRGSVWVLVKERDIAGMPLSTPHVVNQLDRGHIFGELGVHTVFEARQATILTKEDSNDFLRIDKEEFRAILDLALRREFEMVRSFLKEHLILRDLPSTVIDELCTVAQIQTYKAHAVIMAADEPFEFVYFVMSGQARLVRKINLNDKVGSATGLNSTSNNVSANSSMDPTGEVAQVTALPRSSKFSDKLQLDDVASAGQVKTLRSRHVSARCHSSPTSRTVSNVLPNEYLVASGFFARGSHFAPWISKLTAVADQKV